MNWQRKISVLLLAGLAALSGHAQTAGKYLAPRDQLIAIRAGRLFDARSGTMLTNQVVIVRGDRIAEVGSGLAIPSGANVIDLSNATVMPGMIDAHVHINTRGETEAQRTLIAVANAQIDLAAGFTTVLDMDSRGGYNTVDIRDQINSGRSGPAHGPGAVSACALETGRTVCANRGSRLPMRGETGYRARGGGRDRTRRMTA